MTTEGRSARPAIGIVVTCPVVGWDRVVLLVRLRRGVRAGVSTAEQNSARQVDELTAAGCHHV